MKCGLNRSTSSFSIDLVIVKSLMLDCFLVQSKAVEFLGLSIFFHQDIDEIYESDVAKKVATRYEKVYKKVHYDLV